MCYSKDSYKPTRNEEKGNLKLNRIILDPKKLILFLEERMGQKTKRRPNLMNLQVVPQS